MSQPPLPEDKPRQDKQLGNTIDKLLQHRFARINASVWSALWAHFLNGIAFGLGSVLGATIVVYMLVIALSQLEFIPIIGDWASQIITEINSAKADVSR